MAATPKSVSKIKLDVLVERKTYDAFMKMCSKKGYSANVIVEKFLKDAVEKG